MQLNSYLNFNGQCEAAFKFYERCLGGKIQMMMTYGESPMAEQVTPESRNKIIHVTMAVGDGLLMGSDAMGSDAPPQRYEKPQGFFVQVAIEHPDDAERLFQALSENGTVRMPLQQTFWAARFGMLVDQFGTPWMINCSQPAKDN
jgi:PhnB protein